MGNTKGTIWIGLVLALALAAAGYGLGRLVPVVGGAVFSIGLGMAVASLWRRPAGLEPGIRFASKSVLQGAVILLGFEMTIGSVVAVGGQSLWVILVTVTTAFVTVMVAGRFLKINRTLQVMIGVGTAICGGSAIAAAASAIQADAPDI